MLKRPLAFLSFLVLFGTVFTFSFGHQALLKSADENKLAEKIDKEYSHSGEGKENDYVKSFDDLNITLHPGSEFTPDDQTTPSSLNHCKSLVYRTLKSLPEEAASQLKNLTLYFSKEGRRGLGGGSTIILKCLGDKETVSVFTHEMGHITDTGLLQGTFQAGVSQFKDGGHPVYLDDPSVLFYNLSFKNEQTLREESVPADFVSGYAMSDPFEDFAESYNYYILHGEEFRELKKTNRILLKKYVFLKIWVFHGKEFFNGSGEVDPGHRDYDTTVLDYDLNKFFVL